MKIYIAHSQSFDYKKELYKTLEESILSNDHELIFPHKESDTLFNSKSFFQTNCDLIVAEVSYPSIGLGIESGWADLYKIQIICIYKKGKVFSNSLRAVSDTFIEYSDSGDLIFFLNQIIKK